MLDLCMNIVTMHIDIYFYGKDETMFENPIMVDFFVEMCLHRSLIVTRGSKY